MRVSNGETSRLRSSKTIFESRWSRGLGVLQLMKAVGCRPCRGSGNSRDGSGG